MKNNKQQNAVDWLVGQLQQTRDWQRVINEANQSSSSVRDVVQQAKEMYHDEIEAAIIKNCATDSTSAAHKSSVFRNHIIAAFDQGVIAEFTHQVSGAPETSGQEYFNQTYGDGVQ